MASPRQLKRLAAFDALSLMRERDYSLTRAAEFVGLTRAQVLKEVGQAIYKQSNGRYKAKKWDRISRFMNVPTATGTEVVEVRDSRTAQKLGALWAATKKALTEGDPTDLQEIGSSSFQSRGQTYEPLTDLAQLKRLSLAGELRFENIYDLTQGGTL